MEGRLGELLLILILALIVFGPKRLPEFGRALGTGIRELKKALSDISDEKPKSDDTPKA